ncbi:DMT family transporter [Phytoactinopolyspora halotolerans]|uniref:EamA family transporter n=1 Tax=Phytoactinopolyspora halotolerans TaxID=1981512 RepID=A0A6L9S998_9ACTN|nr:DMT family transporter [Phytoactinopolyspora halotolerans]NEE00550.1 EamA family transporter [Phytoactinopolyspora halotolerans]
MPTGHPVDARPPAHTRAILLAFLVTSLWSSSWVLIKIGLDDIPPLTFAGLRYAGAFLCLLPLALRRPHLDRLGRLGPGHWPLLIALGLVMYTVTQGAQFLALDRLPAATVSLLLSFSPAVVALLGTAFLAERTRPAQWAGIGVYLIGAAVFLYPTGFAQHQLAGLAIAALGLLANASAAVLGRAANRTGTPGPLVVTTVSMGAGAAVLLAVGLMTQGLPALPVTGWVIVGWLAVVNTAVAFTMWNLTLRTLSATESSVINNTMLIQVAVLAWVFLGESLELRQVCGLAVASLGVLVVQLCRGRASRIC